MKTFTESELREALDRHEAWLRDEGGERADLSDLDLSRADLQSADLRSANLRSANLRSANLRLANLRAADLRSADLRSADLRWADLRLANLRAADLRSADLRSADLRWADLRSANLRLANLRWADLQLANLRWADLQSANLRAADLQSADLRSANLRSANLRSANLRLARGISPERVQPLLILLDQPGKIHAYKMVDSDGHGPYAAANGHDSIWYEIGETYTVKDVDTDPNVECGAGISLCTLNWALKEWGEGYRLLVCEFGAEDIVCIPTASDGKFRVRKCKVIGEYDPTPIFEREQKEREEWENERGES